MIQYFISNVVDFSQFDGIGFVLTIKPVPSNCEISTTFEIKY